MNKCGKCCYGVMKGANRLFCSVQNCLCEEVLYCEDYEPIVKPQTNADRIRSMTNEELADWYFDKVSSCVPYCSMLQDGCPEHDDCKICLLEWLRQECE